MRSKNTIFINGRYYDTVSGLPVVESPQQKDQEHSETHASAVQRAIAKHHHPKPHHSTTLRRELVKKPQAAHHETVKPTLKEAHSTVSKSPAISKFAPHTPTDHTSSNTSTSKSDTIADVQSKTPPVVDSIHQKLAAKKTVDAKPAQARKLKDYLIEAQMADAQPNTKDPHHARRRSHLKTSSLIAGSIGLMVLGGYLSYINMPNLSVRVAAAKSGVNASYPGYTPTGYRFNGPVAYGDGQVQLSFGANGGTSKYVITQQKSQWDSRAVLDNYVVMRSNDYNINNSGGLTIYTYKNSAAWVSNGILYTIDGDAPLRTDQVLRIAQSI